MDDARRMCDLCRTREGRPFLWTYDSQREGTRTKTNYFCASCEADTRHMCTGGVVEKMSSWELDCKVTITQTYEGIHTVIHDGPKSSGLRLRFAILKRDNYRCQLCGATAQDGVKLEVDHKHPKSRGGPATMENLWTLCYPCNHGKSADSL